MDQRRLQLLQFEPSTHPRRENAGVLTQDELVTVTIRLVLAALLGALIGLERTYHGRPAGFRTHTLVSSASALLMLLTVFSTDVLSELPLEAIRLDPTRMAQGIMTGIGFLGAGVIFQDRRSIRGLTTAASVWMTASIGIIIGVGMFAVAAIAALISIGALAGLRWVEARVPAMHYARVSLNFEPDFAGSEQELRNALERWGCTVTDTSYHYEQHAAGYEMTVRTQHVGNFQSLAADLKKIKGVSSYHVLPTDS